MFYPVSPKYVHNGISVNGHFLGYIQSAKHAVIQCFILFYKCFFTFKEAHKWSRGSGLSKLGDKGTMICVLILSKRVLKVQFELYSAMY